METVSSILKAKKFENTIRSSFWIMIFFIKKNTISGNGSYLGMLQDLIRRTFQEAKNLKLVLRPFEPIQD
jgi:hypothetical protein